MKINMKAIGKAIKRAAPAASIVTGGILMFFTGYKTAKAEPVIKEHIEQKKLEVGRDKLTIKETVQACGKDILPIALLGTGGAAGLAGGIAGYEGAVKTLTGAVATTSAILDEQTKEMQKAIGEEKAAEIVNTATNKVVEKTTQNASYVAMTPFPEELFKESLTGRLLKSSEYWIRTCVNCLNEEQNDRTQEELTDPFAAYDENELAKRRRYGGLEREPIMLEDMYRKWVDNKEWGIESVAGKCLGFPRNVHVYFKPEILPDGTTVKVIHYEEPCKSYMLYT